MGWSYNASLPTDKDWVRFRIGDTIEAQPQLQDEEILALLDITGSREEAAIEAARALMALYSRLVDKSVGDLRLSYSQRLTAYKELIRHLEARAALGGVPFAGGISKAQKETVEADTDRVEPSFTKNQFSHPGTGGGSSDDPNGN